MKIILHTGFHKTGTTSVQETLRANRKLLAPDLRIIMRPSIKALCQAARGWSASKSELDLGLVAYEAAMLGEALQKETAQTVIISAEDLCGHMPGRNGVKTYGAAPQLMQSIATGLTAALPDVSLTFFLTTRGGQEWLTSCHAQHLAASRMRLNHKDYVRIFKGSAHLDAIVADIAKAVEKYPVCHTALETHAMDILGPAAALFDLLDLDTGTRARLKPARPANAALDGVDLGELLALNQSELDDDAVRAAKAAVLKGAG